METLGLAILILTSRNGIEDGNIWPRTYDEAKSTTIR